MNQHELLSHSADIIGNLIGTLSEANQEEKDLGLAMIATLAVKAKLSGDVNTMAVLMAFFIIAQTHTIDGDVAAANQLESAAKFNRLVQESFSKYAEQASSAANKTSNQDMN